LIELQCACGTKTRVASTDQGKLARCRKCKVRQRVPKELEPAELIRMLEARKVERTHHYVFAHRIVPEVALKDPAQVLTLLRGPEGNKFLQDLWAEVGESCPANLPSEGLRLTLEEVEGLDEPMALIRLPEPEIPPEAHYLAIVPWCEKRLLGLVQKRSLRCFTLEQGIKLSGGLRTVLCEWTRSEKGELVHRNYGVGPEPNTSAFLARLSEVLAG
jgi:hypothetical protein